jgi:hypothetical protein
MKNVIIGLFLVVLLGASSTLYVENAEPIDLSQYSTTGLDLSYTVMEATTISQDKDISKDKMTFYSPLLDRSYVGFKEALGFKESSGRYDCVNTLGYLGKYQFGSSTLKVLGIRNTTAFLKSSALQEKAFLANASRNKWVLRREIKLFVGKRVDGVLITESGILAAAHLAGPGNVKRYLRSYGAFGFSDAFGTSIKSYLKNFRGYDVSFVIGNKRPKVL